MTDASHSLAPPVEQLSLAIRDSVRADILLRLSDFDMMAYGVRLGQACEQAGYQDGADYCAARLGALFAMRGRHGLLHRDPVMAWERARQALIRCAGLEPTEALDDGR